MIDPWWNPPRPLPWQQAYHRLRTAATGADGVAAADLPRGLCRWIRVQQESWEHLHPGQQGLLIALSITPHTAVGERPAPATRSYPASPGLDHARTYAAQHCHLTPDKHTQHEGFPLGRWLCQQRRKARAGVLSTTTVEALTALDPWWNPPGPTPGTAPGSNTTPSAPQAGPSRRACGAGPLCSAPTGTDYTPTNNTSSPTPASTRRAQPLRPALPVTKPVRSDR
jgi:hypothetical protein